MDAKGIWVDRIHVRLVLCVQVAALDITVADAEGFARTPPPPAPVF